VGGGLRIATLTMNTQSNDKFSIYLYTGTGFMWENEFIKTVNSEQTNILRSTNYISCKGELNKILLFSLTGYYQVDTSNFSDFRILLDGRVSFQITEKVSVSTDMNIRFDHEPPSSVKKYDLEITNGVDYYF
jgi:hypothetical protein